MQPSVSQCRPGRKKAKGLSRSACGRKSGVKYRLIAIDLDGTLVNREGDILSSSKKAIQRAIDSGMKVALATGRMYRPSTRFAQELQLSTPIICYQGALIREPYSRNVLWHKPLSVPTARGVIEQARQTGVQLLVYIDDEVYVEEITQRGLWYAQRNGVALHLVKGLATFLERQPTVIVAWGESAGIDRLITRLDADFGSSLLVTKSYPSFCEIGHPASGKGNALKYLAKRLGIKRSQTVAIGDGPNDISMLKWAGLGIVIGAAPEEVTAAADWVVDTETEDSFAEVVEKLLDM